jgi:hypothetical protein
LSRRLERLSGQINGARTEVEPSAKQDRFTGIIGFFRWAGVEGSANLRTLINMATGKGNSATREVLFEAIQRADNKRIAAYKKLVEAWGQGLGKANINWTDVKESLQALTTIRLGGKKVELTLNDLLSVYAHTQATGNLEQMLKTEGLNITTYKNKLGGIWRKRTNHRTATPTLNELRAVEELIPPKLRKLLDIHFAVAKGVQAPLINETSLELNNFELARLDKFFHLSREHDWLQNIKGRIFTSSEIASAIEEQGRYMPRTGGTARINIRPFTMEVVQGLQQDSFYHAMTIPMENARTLLANKAWRQGMKAAGRQRELATITKMIGRMQMNSSDQSMVDRTLMSLLSRAAKSILGLRVSGGAVQVASLPVAFTVIDRKHFHGTGLPSKAKLDALMERVPSLWLRWKAKQYDFAAGMVTAQNAFENLLFDHESLTDKSLKPYTVGDQTAIWKIFMAAENQIAETTALKRETAEFDEAVIHLFDRAMETQPMWSTLYRTEITSDPSVATRSFAMFMSARSAQHNVLLQALDAEQKGRITKAVRNKHFQDVATANFLVSLFRHMVKTAIKGVGLGVLVALGIRPAPDEEELKEEAARLAKKLPQETVLNIIGLNALGQVAGGLAFNALRVYRLDYSKIEPGQLRSGNLLIDMMGDLIQTTADGTLTFKHLILADRWKSGPDKGDLKWVRFGTRFANDVALLMALGLGLPLEGPKSDVYFPIKSLLKEQPKKRKSGF